MNRFIITKTSSCGLVTPYVSRFMANNIEYQSTLQYYVKRKQEILDGLNKNLSEKIMKTSNPEELMDYSHKIKNYNSHWWHIQLRYRILTHGNMFKFSQNEGLKRYLLAYSNNLIIYESNDNIWGTGLDFNGKNLLGHSLMETAKQL